MRMKVKEVAKLIDGEVIGDENIVITGVSGIKEAKPGDLTFIANKKYKNLLYTTKASAIIVGRDITNSVNATLIQVDNPSIAFAKIMSFVGPEPIVFPPGIHPTAIIGKNVSLGKDVSIQPYVVIEDYVKIGDKTVIGAGVYIGHYTEIGNECLIYPKVVIRERIKIGNRVIIHPGTVIGGDGFGFATVKGVHHKIPQIGTVEIGDDVEIGSNVTIDRARFDKTYIGNGVKIDNLVQIAHNVYIGDNSIIVAQVGISGSTVIGKNVIIAGQAGIIGHITVGDNSVIGGKAGVTKNVPPNTHVTGFPAREKWEDMRFHAYIRKLPELLEKIKQLEEKIEKLEKKDG
ncbi:MAG: UDP-3-O-(3-hydroxymyristoyl)glucosamine N-acyltransferase [Candidatus Omnitrophica bacterium]|nr:UDP-3-O-(3-hydroxymyristoyl)glucosamine N-acyltransferase [Candidatus Omnitrophota bacterium]MCM8802748.1 UDP-3-O-(3-hydroxymyristoyl)glucosamine N-acyltransferase [Candidatus Omnitrophota bacterium]